MIETIQAQSGDSVLRYQGRLLASRFDPNAEAEAWLDRRMAFLDKVRGVFVLGAASGYHIRSLLKRTTAQVLVIEHNHELVEAVRDIHGEFSRDVNIEFIQNVRALRSTTSIREFIRNSFVVLTHPASFAQQPEFYQECSNQLNGREWGALTWQWHIKGFANLDSAPRLSAGGKGLLSIYDLEQTELVQNSEERERLLIKALRELVK